MKKIIYVLLCWAFILKAQNITWTNVTSSYSLPDGVELYKGERTSPILKTWYLKVDMNNPKIAIKSYLSTVAF